LRSARRCGPSALASQTGRCAPAKREESAYRSIGAPTRLPHSVQLPS
jgi:hypothetical protein